MWAGTAKSGPEPKSTAWTPPATLVATTNGMNAREENSNSSSSMARTTAASGVPNVAAMPAAAPQASRILRSLAETWSTCPTSDPRAPPVTMIGPSAPNGPPVPIATAADRGLATAVRGATLLRRVRTASMASGMPWPRMIGDQRASSVTSPAPAIAVTTTAGPMGRSAKLGRVVPQRWNRARLVRTAMNLIRSHAVAPATRPRAAASTQRSTSRRGGWLLTAIPLGRFLS